MKHPEEIVTRPEELNGLSVTEVLAVITASEAVLAQAEVILQNEIQKIVEKHASALDLTPDEYIQEYLWPDRATVEQVFEDLIDEGVPYEFIRQNLKLSDSVPTPQYSF